MREYTHAQLRSGVRSFPAQEADDAGEVLRRLAVSDVESIERGCLRAERSGEAGRACRILRKGEVLEHHRGGEARLVSAIGGGGPPPGPGGAAGLSARSAPP